MKYVKFKEKLDRANEISKTTYKLSSGYKNTNSIYSNLSQKELKDNYNFSNKYSGISSYAQYKSYLATKRYNTGLFLSTLWKILILFAPFIIISVIMSTDNFQFDFFIFVKRFENLQFTLTDKLIGFLRNLRNWEVANVSFVDAQNGLDVLKNIGIGIAALGLLIFKFITCFGFIITFIVDFFSSVFAFVGALIPSLTYSISPLA